MSVKVEASGRRYVQVEVEVPGTPEEVWEAIATGAGISSWFVPTRFTQTEDGPAATRRRWIPRGRPGPAPLSAHRGSRRRRRLCVEARP
jgi:uncharacterized protein YndB with AHSA1/START domain